MALLGAPLGESIVPLGLLTSNPLRRPMNPTFGFGPRQVMSLTHNHLGASFTYVEQTRDAEEATTRRVGDSCNYLGPGSFSERRSLWCADFIRVASQMFYPFKPNKIFGIGSIMNEQPRTLASPRQSPAFARTLPNSTTLKLAQCSMLTGFAKSYRRLECFTGNRCKKQPRFLFNNRNRKCDIMPTRLPRLNPSCMQSDSNTDETRKSKQTDGSSH